MYSDSPEDAFEKGAGAPIESVRDLFLSATSMVTIFLFLIVVIASYIAWKRGNLPFDELIMSVLKVTFILVVVAGFLAAIYK